MARQAGVTFQVNAAAAVAPAAFLTDSVTRYVTLFPGAAAFVTAPLIVPPLLTDRPGGKPDAEYARVSPQAAPSET